MEEKKNNKKFILITFGIIGTILLVVGITYAYWILTREQTRENVVNSACLNINFVGENDINLPNAYPMTNEQLDKFLSTATPYHFTITNECDDLANVTINLESLNAGTDKQLEDQYINAVLYQTNYKANLFKNKKLTEDVLNDENKVIKESLHAYKLYSFTLKQNEEKEFNLQLYLDQDTPRSEETMNASWKGKITLSSEYKEDRFRNSGTLRAIGTSNDGMWGYKDKLTKIVIETKKEEKIAQEGETKYGPFNEGEGKTDAVVSYVICDSDETNCTGYLQGEGGVKANSDSSNVFDNFSKVTTIEGLENFDTSGVTTMNRMFYGMKNLQELDVSSFDTSGVTNMFQMFYNCSKLNNLNVSGFSTDKVTTMKGMFSGLSKLQTIDLSSFDTSSVDDMSSMFDGMSNLQELDISSLDTSSVKDMSKMFYGMSSLRELNLKSFNTNQVANMSSMFDGMSNLQTLSFGDNFNTSQVKDMKNMFNNCSDLQKLDLSPLDTKQVIDMSSMFAGMKNLQELDLKSLNTGQVKKMRFMFADMTGLTSLNLSTFDTSEVTDMLGMFQGMSNLQNLNFGDNFNTSQVNTMSGMFSRCSSLQKINLSNFDTSQVTDMSSMFSGMSNLDSITFGSNFVTNSVDNMRNMFRDLVKITSLDLSYFDTTNVTNMIHMFGGDTLLTKITYGPNFVHNVDATTNAMFGGTYNTDTSSLCPANKPNADIHPSWTDVSFD